MKTSRLIRAIGVPLIIPCVFAAVSMDAHAQGTGTVYTERGKCVALLSTGFEEPLPPFEIPHHTITDGLARSGRQALEAAVAEPDQYLYFDVPFDNLLPDPLVLRLWIKSDAGSATGVFAGCSPDMLRPVAIMRHVPQEWTLLEAWHKPLNPGKGLFRVAAPASIEAPPGRVWIDDLELARATTPAFTRPGVEDRPVMAADAAGRIWVAVLDYSLHTRQVRVYRAGDTAAEPVHVLRFDDAAAVGSPVITGLDHGCFVAAPVEQEANAWRIFYAFLENAGSLPDLQSIATEGTANIHPAVTAHEDRVCMVWEANPEGRRGVYAAWIDRDCATQPQRISDASAISRNPDVVALDDGSLFAAWDSVRRASADLYGAWYRDGSWQAEQRLTGHPSIERHVALASWDSQVWMTWQAESFRENLVNGPEDQRIVVAVITDGGLQTPRGFFEKVSPTCEQLKRPRVAFDPAGRLWVTARKSIGYFSGWAPMAWCYSGARWSGPHALWLDEGRWRGVDLAWNKEMAIAAVQRDSGVGHAGQARRSEVMLVAIPPEWALAGEGIDTIPLEMPATTFVLQDRIDRSAAALPRQHAQYKGKTLALWWGDLHEHTALSQCQRALNPPACDLYANQCDIEALDFTAITDHGYNLDECDWAYLQAETTGSHDPGRFVTFLAEEWTSDHINYEPPRTYKRYGHRNLVFLDPHFPSFYNSHDGDISPCALWDQLTGREYISIPHQLADHGTNCPTDWSFVDERVQPLAEICQQRGSYEYEGCPRQAEKVAKGHFLQDAWAMGITIGVIASPDHSGGRGKAGIWAGELTRESLFEAFHARHTFGTSDAKIALFVRSGDAMMGDKAARRGSSPIAFRIEATAMRPVSRVVVFRNNEPVYDAETNETEIRLDWVDAHPPPDSRLWYYVRIHCDDGELAWSSPIWFITDD